MVGGEAQSSPSTALWPYATPWADMGCVMMGVPESECRGCMGASAVCEAGSSHLCLPRC